MINLDNKAADNASQKGLTDKQLKALLKRKGYKAPKGKFILQAGIYPMTWLFVKD
jgi:hypothetical protein